jgi:hypothetical protein
MSDQWKNGPQSYAEANNMAQRSQNLSQPANTTLWSDAARQNYYRAGGK